MVRLILGLAALVCSCAEPPPSELGEDEFRRLVTQEGMHVDSVGVRDLAQGDTLVDYSPLVVIERTVRFPREAEGGEVFAWEFYAEQLNPVKLLIVRTRASTDTSCANRSRCPSRIWWGLSSQLRRRCRFAM